MKRRDGLVLNAGELFVYIKDIAIVAAKRNSKTLIGIKEFDKTLLPCQWSIPCPVLARSQHDGLGVSHRCFLNQSMAKPDAFDNQGSM